MTRLLRKFAKNDDGSTLLFVAAGIVAIVTVVGVVVDMSRYAQTKSQFRNAVDQAALATATSSVATNRAGMNAVAREYMEANFIELGKGAKLTNLNVTYDSTKVEWTASASATTKPSFMTLLGINSVTLEHTAKVQWDEVTTEVVFAVDVSASMCATFDDRAREQGVLKVIPDRDCKKLSAVREALRYLVMGDTAAGSTWRGLPAVVTRDGRPAYKVGIVPFNHKVKFPDVNKVPRTLANSEITNGDRNYFKVFNADPGAAETAQFPLPTITPLVELRAGSDRTRLQTAINNLKTNYDVPGWTRSNLGLMTAALMLDPQFHTSFGGARPADEGTARNEKIVFLLTDGANMGCCFSDHPTGTYQNQYLYTYRTDNLHMSGPVGRPEEGLCGALKNQGYKVFTLVYDVQDNDAQGGGAAIKQILSDCATGPVGENYFDLQLDEGDKIREAYQQIAKTLMRLRLSH